MLPPQQFGYLPKSSNLHSADFFIPFWLHILIGQWYVCAKKRAKADWLMTCAKADWLTTNVIIFPCSLIGQFKISLCYDFGCDVICAICGGKIVPTLATLVENLWTSLWASFKSFGSFIEKNQE